MKIYFKEIQLFLYYLCMYYRIYFYNFFVLKNILKN